MHDASLKPHLLHSASYVVLDMSVCVCPSETHAESTASLITRIRIWLSIWGGPSARVTSVSYGPRPAPNRTKARLQKRRLPMARRASALGGILYRFQGRARYLRFLYDEQLTGRERWCFTKWNWSWLGRLCFLTCEYIRDAEAFCNAPLFPD